MYNYTYDAETGGILLNTTPMQFNKEPRPVYYRELDLLGFDKYWNYEKQDDFPYMWAEANKYYYFGQLVAQTKGGNLYTKPEILLAAMQYDDTIENPEGKVVLINPEETVKADDPLNLRYNYLIFEKLRPVNINKMLEKNADFLQVLAQETVKKIYDVWKRHKNKLDIFHVAFSGGKDSIVLLDLVKKALPKDEFVVVFGDTQMEFPDTYDVADKIEAQCKAEGIRFFRAKSHMDVFESWRLFGPPSRRVRWCCTVMKTAPVMKLLREENRAAQIMMVTGVRSEESLQRSDYEEFSIGNKVAGQYSFHPILNWTSFEIYLHVYNNNLIFNDAYKYGFNRVGCVVCPNSSGKHEYLKRVLCTDETDKYLDIIADTTTKDLSGENRASFLANGGWKMRTTGHELTVTKRLVDFNETKTGYEIELDKYLPYWKEWYAAVGDLIQIDDRNFELEYKGIYYPAQVNEKGNKLLFFVKATRTSKDAVDFVHYLRAVFIKTYYCIGCGDCVVECPKGNITQAVNTVTIESKCDKCKACLKMDNGCTYYDSIKGIKGAKQMTGLNRYLSVGVKREWIVFFFENGGEPGARKTDVMYAFLTDAGVLRQKKFTAFGNKIKEIGLFETTSWALMLCELVYSPAFNWFVKNIPFGQPYTLENLKVALSGIVTDKAIGEFWNGFKQILDTMPYGYDIRFGMPDIERKITKSGNEEKKLLSITRWNWISPEPLVILYSLYKFAEACGDYHEFTISRLRNFNIDSDGISPMQIFGVGEDEIRTIVRGLGASNPDFITAKFTLDLDTVLLNKNKSASDVLSLL